MFFVKIFAEYKFPHIEKKVEKRSRRKRTKNRHSFRVPAAQSLFISERYELFNAAKFDGTLPTSR